ncbi:MAG: class I SAM-dependent methyltransferase [Planctomycetota bacterium]
MAARSNGTEPRSKTAKPARARRTGFWRTASNSDRHELYELAVQEVVSECEFIDRAYRSVRGRLPALLREDFCGTAKACSEWVRRRRTNRAIGIDLDRSVLAWGERRHRANLPAHMAERIEIVNGNVLTAQTPPADVVVAMNFSYFIFRQRAQLVGYFRRVFESLAADGLFVCDAYGGSQAHAEQEEERSIDGFTYVWHQARYNPITGDVRNHIHFRFPDGSEMKRAFTYEWRLWSLPEIKDAMLEAGFVNPTVYWEGTDHRSGTGNGRFRPSTRGEACEGWIAYIVAEKPVKPSARRPRK